MASSSRSPQLKGAQKEPSPLEPSTQSPPQTGPLSEPSILHHLRMEPPFPREPVYTLILCLNSISKDSAP